MADLRVPMTPVMPNISTGPEMPENTKTCRGCNRTLPLDHFWRRQRGRDGFNPRCKDCLAKTPEQRAADREYTRRWNQANPERHEAGVQAYCRRHPERRAARNAVYYATKRGKLERQPCEVCGDSDSQAHHDDYSRKLEVRWLCRTHHGETHRLLLGRYGA